MPAHTVICVEDIQLASWLTLELHVLASSAGWLNNLPACQQGHVTFSQMDL